jgi:tRNA (guanine-N7-)-methyltransferase
MDDLQSMSNLLDTPHPRSIRSFVKRSGRVTTGQLKARHEIGGAYLVDYAPQALDISDIFPHQSNETPLVFEIGFGMGEATALIAQTLSNTNFICCEVHDPGVGALLKRIGENGIKNIRIIQHDAVEVLEHMIQNLCLDGIHIFFPDPWHKKKHNKRRLVQSEFIKSIVPKLKVGGYIHCATDWEAYAVQMLEVLSSEKTLTNTSKESSGYAIKPEYRPLTKFENRGLKLGHGVWDLVFKKN